MKEGGKRVEKGRTCHKITQGVLRFLLRSNSYFLIQLKFNLSEKICSSNQTENLFDVLNALFDGSYFDEIDFDEIDSSRSR